MKQLFILALINLCCTAVFGQTGKLTGVVQDAEVRTPLELATVSILNPDSSLHAYQLSDKNGRFSFDKLPLKKTLLVNVTYTGYKAYYTTIKPEAGKTDTLAVLLALNMADTNAIVITTTVPVRMNGDTLEINPAAFKMNGDAVVEELLNQVSGITIWSDGSITVNGQKVQSLLVDGKPFMGSTDGRVATQNLPKAAIDKIQLYQEYDRSNIGRQSQQQRDSALTMNIKLKEGSKKGYFGKAGAGYGSRERFEADLSFQMYNKRSSAGFGVGINNINKSIGNLQELFQNNTYRNYNPNLYSVGRFGAQGINKNYSFGGVVTHNFDPTENSRQQNRLTTNYNTSGTNGFLSDLSLQNRTTKDNPQVIRDDGLQNTNTQRHDIGVNYVRTNSYDDNLSVNGTINTANEKLYSTRFTEVRDSASQLQSTNSITTDQRRRSDNESLNISFAKSDRDEPLKQYNITVNARRSNSHLERDVESVFTSITDRSKSTAYNRRYLTSNESVDAGGTLDYLGFKRLLLGRYNFFKINLNFTQIFNYSKATDNNLVSDYDSAAKRYVTNANISNLNRRELFEYSPALVIGKDFFTSLPNSYKGFSVQVRLLQDIRSEKNESSIAKRNLNRSFRFFRYEGNLRYNLYKQNKFQLYASGNYVKNYRYPQLDALYTIVDDINAYEIRIGNPNLQNTVSHAYSFQGNAGTQNPKAVYTVNGSFNGNYTTLLDPVVDSVINDRSGKRISYYINADRSSTFSLNYNFNISRALKKNRIQLMYSGGYNAGKTPNFIDGIYNTSETGSLSNQVNLQFSLRSLLVFTLGQSWQYYRTTQSSAALTSFKNTSNTTKLGLVLNFPAHVTFSSTLDRIANSNLEKPTVLWNAFASYRIMKDQAELKFSAMDILRQYQNISNYVNAYGTNTRITNGLQQFFLATFSYYPRKFGKTEIKRQAPPSGPDY